MLLTITYTGRNTPDLGYLLYKNPYRAQTFAMAYGKAHVFYPEVSDERTTAALLLDLDPIELVRGKGAAGLFDYVNDRPYVSSSFMSTAISKVFGTAMTGRADEHQGLSDTPLDLSATVTMLPCRGQRDKLNAVFEPLGYAVAYEGFMEDGRSAPDDHVSVGASANSSVRPASARVPDWGESPYVNLTISGTVCLRDLLKHLYVLIPVFDARKHYWVGADEVDKLLRAGEGWLGEHPEKEYITSRYLKRRRSLITLAYSQLTSGNATDGDRIPLEEEEPQPRPSLNAQRYASVYAALKQSGARTVIDLGCGEGHLLAMLVRDSQFTRVAGMDVSHVSLEYAARRLRLNDASESMRERVTVFQGALTYRDDRLSGYDAASLVEVIEHLDPSRLSAFEQVVFGYARPGTIVLTTPNKEYNVNYEFLGEDEVRHTDHRFEWTRAEFQNWAKTVAATYGYQVGFTGIGDVDDIHGTPTQMAVFYLPTVVLPPTGSPDIGVVLPQAGSPSPAVVLPPTGSLSPAVVLPQAGSPTPSPTANESEQEGAR